jgi:hypothetical protein
MGVITTGWNRTGWSATAWKAAASKAVLCAGLVVLSVVATPRPGVCGDVVLTVADGRVTVVAHGATPREILAEWARVGGTTIVNLDRVQGAALSLEFTNVPEAQVLEVLLRSVGGYMAAPRPVAAPNRSVFSRIFIMPGTLAPRAPAQAAFAPSPSAPQVQMQQTSSDPADAGAGAPMFPVQADVTGPASFNPGQPVNMPPTNARVPGFAPFSANPVAPTPTSAGRPPVAGPAGSPAPGMALPGAVAPGTAAPGVQAPMPIPNSLGARQAPQP